MAKVEQRILWIEQGRAARAYEMVEEAKKALGKDDKKYKSYVKRIPMLIKTNGLAATLAFVKSKSKENAKETPYNKIYNQMAAWLREKELLTDETKLVEEIITLPSPQYRLVTAEVLALFNWLRRFAEGLIEGDADDES